MWADGAWSEASAWDCVAADLPRDGESLYPPSLQDKSRQLDKDWRQDDPRNDSPAAIAREGLVEVLCADCNAADPQALVVTHKAAAPPPLGTPVKLGAERFCRVPRASVHGTDNAAVSYAPQHAMLERAGGAHPVVTPRTSHRPTLSRPRALADAIVAALR